MSDQTRQFYAREAETYTATTRQQPSERLGRFLAQLPQAAAIIELGCGGGQDSAAMIEAGFEVTPTDGTPEMAQIATKRLGRHVAVLPFDQIEAVDAYDGVWANASLLHAPRDALPEILARILRATRAGGLFFASYKTGKPEGPDRFGRYYNQPEKGWLHTAYEDAGWTGPVIELGHEPGYFGEPSDWLFVTAVKA